jgi:hypothetical protein
VHGGAPAAGPVGLSLQVRPVRLLAAEVALRQFDEQRRGRLGDRGQVIDAHQPVRVTGRAPGQAVQALERLSFVPVQVTHRVEDDGPALPPFGVHPQHRLLGHRAAGQEGRRGLVQQPGDLSLQFGNNTAVAVTVDGGVAGDVGQQASGAHRPVAGQEHRALVAQRGLLGAA